jgi:exosortase H (IPTLxxWG-CTERM-specific)
MPPSTPSPSPDALSAIPSWWRNKRPIWAFTLRFGLLMALFYTLSLLPWADRVAFPAYMHANAAAGSCVLNLLGQETHVDGIAIRSAHFTVNIKRGCDAVEPSWLLAACIVSFPAATVAKLWGTLAGVALLQVLNLVRLVSLFLVGPRWPSLFETLHLEVWPMVFIVAALSLWFIWQRQLPRSASVAHAPA